MRTYKKSFFSRVFGVARFVYLKMRYGKRFQFKGIGLVGRNARIYIEGSLKVGENVFFGENCFIDLKGHVEIGSNCFFNDNLRLVCHDKIVIGDNVLVGPNVSFYDHDHNYILKSDCISYDGYVTSKIIIGSNIWIGENVKLLKGIKINNNVIIGASSIVTSDILSNSLVSGVPASKIRNL
ncbi:MAG: acyltransferase [Saprospiraceae bacterium]|nr:acyltransferase [Saprospiraceae bacterium]